MGEVSFTRKIICLGPFAYIFKQKLWGNTSSPPWMLCLRDCFCCPLRWFWLTCLNFSAFRVFQAKSREYRQARTCPVSSGEVRHLRRDISWLQAHQSWLQVSRTHIWVCHLRESIEGINEVAACNFQHPQGLTILLNLHYAGSLRNSLCRTAYFKFTPIEIVKFCVVQAFFTHVGGKTHS